MASALGRVSVGREVTGVLAGGAGGVFGAAIAAIYFLFADNKCFMIGCD